MAMWKDHICLAGPIGLLYNLITGEMNVYKIEASKMSVINGDWFMLLVACRSKWQLDFVICITVVYVCTNDVIESRENKFMPDRFLK